MKRLVEIVCFIIIAFTLSSLFLYRSLVKQPSPQRIASQRREIDARVETAEGEISGVDAGNQTVILTNGNRSLTLSLDDKTVLSESGHAVRLGAITAGAKVAVRYRRKGGRYWADHIELLSANGN